MPPDSPTANAVPKPRRISGKKLVLGLAAVVLVLLIIGGIKIKGAIDELLEAENRLHATIVVIEAVEKYLELPDNPGWPRSWDDLERVSVDYSWIQWPDEREFVESCVTIDFDATLEEVASQRDSEWTAVVPNGPAFGGWPGSEWAILDVVDRLILERSP